MSKLGSMATTASVWASKTARSSGSKRTELTGPVSPGVGPPLGTENTNSDGSVKCSATCRFVLLGNPGAAVVDGGYVCEDEARGEILDQSGRTLAGTSGGASGSRSTGHTAPAGDARPAGG